MILREKSWVWFLTFPFAHNNYTTIIHTIYHPKGRIPSERVVAHEEIHERQIEENGVFKFYFLYLFALPFLWNPWRKKWEREAYVKGSLYTEERATAMLKRAAYGWLV